MKSKVLDAVLILICAAVFAVALFFIALHVIESRHSDRFAALAAMQDAQEGQRKESLGEGVFFH